MRLSTGLRSSFAWIALLGFAVLAGAASSVIQVQIVVFTVVVAIAFSLYSVKRVLVLAAVLVPTIALLRRLLSASGYTASDPLVLLPYVLVLACLVVCLGRPPQPDRGGRWAVRISIAVALGVAVTLVLRAAFDVQSIYSGLALAVPVLLIAGVVSGRVPDVFSALQRVIPWLALVVGIYGVFQFLFLPVWDRNWMIATDLHSIGAPYPLQVRVFGTAESPGPYASFLGLAVVLALCRAVLSKKPLAQLGWFVLCAALSVPLLLSGVRTCLLAVLICGGVLVVIRGRGVGRIVPLALVVVIGILLTRVLDAVAGSSSVLTADRYTNFNAGTDNSLQSRLNILSYLRNPFAYVIGTPSPGRLDNLSVDVLVSYGLLAGLGITILIVVVLIVALRNLFGKVGEGAALSALFVVITSLSGNVFASPFGILVGFVFASVFVSAAYARPRKAKIPDVEFAKVRA